MSQKDTRTIVAFAKIDILLGCLRIQHHIDSLAHLQSLTMVVEAINERSLDDIHSQSTESQVTDDPALKDSQSGKSSNNDHTSVSSGDESSDFVKKESRRVMYLRVFVLLLLFSASGAISLVVYFVTAAGEKDSFESEYYAAADKVTGKSP